MRVRVPPAAGRPRPGRSVLDHRAGLRLPAAWCRAGRGGRGYPGRRGGPVGPVAQRGHIGGAEGKGDGGDSAVRVLPGPLGEAGHRIPRVITHSDRGRPGGGELQRGADHAGPRPGQGVEHGEGPATLIPGRPGIGQAGQVGRRVAAGLVTPLPGFPPPAEQVQVDLVGLGPGDRVVMRAEDELAPRLVQRLRRVTRPGQPGQGGPALALADRALRRALALLDVDIGHVLAQVHRVHVPGLRRSPNHAGQRRRAPRRRTHGAARSEPGPDVPGVPVPVARSPGGSG